MRNSKLILSLNMMLLLLLACNEDEIDIQSVDCINTASFTIDGGTACNNSQSGSQYTVIDNVANQTRDVTFNFVPPHTFLGPSLTENSTTYTIPLDPTYDANNVTITQVANDGYTGTGTFGYKFGIANTGVPFDPVAAEWWTNTSTGEINGAWNLEVLSTNTGLVYDCNNAHDPNRYHYHGTPITYLQSLGTEDGSQHSGLLGYAADGFPIYYKYGYTDPNDMSSDIVALQSSYSLKTGCRPGDGESAPDGAYNGNYVADYEYDGSGDLDECNGRWSKTPEYPNGTYIYYITDEFPSIPRCFVGTPSSDFAL